ncbi:hypothetical protein DY240_15125 [Jiangella rhizosphaerae]|uniref:Asl1-like glycosyl hydrolase catalytic domain-containing protein n=1 Tax=Jiangella rhizosphaerae TaxID=2293569 RepID=A0A418KPM8_9ACTN|nr:hypothetical protein DY240_15125 [Jiangella rhizosphaerae]
MAAAAGLGPSTAQAADITEVIGDFETAAEVWNLNLGSEFPGAQGTFTRDPADAATGAQSGLVTADFSGGGNYVLLGRAVNRDLTSLSFQVRSAEVSRIGLRLTDSTGQVHQQRIALAPGGAWQQVTVTDFAGGEGNIHYGGANDGIWHGPARSIGLIIDRGFVLTADRTADVRFDAVTGTTPPPVLEVGQTVPGNIFEDSRPVEFDLTTRADSVRWTVTDAWGDQVAFGDTPVDVTAGLTVPVDTPGHYAVEFAAVQDGEVIGTSETDFAVVEEFDPSPSDERFMIAEHLTRPDWGDPDYELVGIADKLGTQRVREDAGWGEIEKQPGVYTYTRYDGMVEALDEAGMGWAPMFGYTNRFYDGNATPYTDEARRGYAAYTVDAIERYDLESVEIYNEFNIGFGDRGDGPADSRADYYFPLLKTAYEAVKAEHPDVTVVGGVTSSIPFQWLEQLFQLGGLEYMDVLSVHPYRFPGAPEGMAADLQRLDALVRQYNDGESIPIWITEQSWPTNTGATGVSEATSAAYLVRAHVVAFANGVERYTWYNMMNKGLNEADVEHRYGLIRNTNDPRGKWTPKPGYAAYAAMTRALDDAAYDHDETVADGVHSHVFDRDGTPVRVLWSDQPVTVSVETAPDTTVSVTDLMGASDTYRSRAGRIHLTLGPAPVYLTGEVEHIAPDDRLTLAPVAEDGAVAAGDDIALELTIDNSVAPRAPIHGTFEIAGTSVPVSVRPGQVATIPVTVPGTDDLGPRDLVGTLRLSGTPAARLTTQVDVVEPLTMTATHRLDDAGADVLRVSVANASVDEVALGELAWTIGGQSGTAQVPAAIAGGGTYEVDIPLAGMPAGRHARELRLTAPDAGDVVSTGTVAVVAPEAVGSFPQRSITVDGVLDDLADVPSIDFLADGVVDIADHGGPDDLGGRLWTTWDDENVYLSARIDDDVHFQSESGTAVWFGDGFQFGFAAGLPGETRAWDELGMSLTENGPELYRWLSAQGRPTGLIEDADLAITRDEAAAETVYELAIPWSELTPFEPEHRLLSFSIILNENDGQERRGWLRYGDGIATAKDPARYSPFRLDPPH